MPRNFKMHVSNNEIMVVVVKESRHTFEVNEVTLNGSKAKSSIQIVNRHLHNRLTKFSGEKNILFSILGLLTYKRLCVSSYDIHRIV